MKKSNKKGKEQNDWTEQYEKDVDLYMKSKGTEKMWNYFLEIAKSDYFAKTIKELRKKYKIPKNGYSCKNKSYLMPPDDLDDKHSTIEKIRNEVLLLICTTKN